MRTVAVVMLVGCELADGDPAAMLAAEAPDAVDCGTAETWADSAVTPGWARVCAIAARNRGESFRVAVAGAVADGADVLGWIGRPDGSGRRLHYQATYAMFPGLDSECVSWRDCAAIVDLGPACATLAGDLCFRCQ